MQVTVGCVRVRSHVLRLPSCCRTRLQLHPCDAVAGRCSWGGGLLQGLGRLRPGCAQVVTEKKLRKQLEALLRVDLQPRKDELKALVRFCGVWDAVPLPALC